MFAELTLRARKFFLPLVTLDIFFHPLHLSGNFDQYMIITCCAHFYMCSIFSVPLFLS